jgi:flagellar biosynthesis/type III secretory pathway protein FliH
VETGNELGDGTTLVFIDLERFCKPIEECVREEDLWMFCIKNMAKQSECPDGLSGTEIEALFIQAELARLTMVQRISYEYSIMSRNDMLNSMREQIEAAREEAEKIGRAKGEAEGRAIGEAEGRAEGREVGRAEGLEVGRAEGRAEAVRKMMAAGMSVGQVCTIMGMTAEEVEKAL